MISAPASTGTSSSSENELRRIRPAGHRDDGVDQVDLPRAEHVERVVGRLRTHFDHESVRKARAIEHRLYDQTWSSPDCDLVPALNELDIPTLVLHREHDFVAVDAAARVAEAMPQGRLSVLPGRGHFSYLEFPELVHSHIESFMQGT